jgi:hypothetical protein
MYGFMTEDEATATAALLVYGVYRSRDPGRLKVTPEFWATIERAVKSSAKRAETVADFVERLKPKLGCATLQPRWLQPDDATTVGATVPGHRAFWADVLGGDHDRPVLDRLYGRTSLVIALVRDRLERERPPELRESWSWGNVEEEITDGDDLPD